MARKLQFAAKMSVQIKTLLMQNLGWGTSRDISERKLRNKNEDVSGTGEANMDCSGVCGVSL